MVTGAKMFLDEINYTVAGRKIELIVEDEGATPATAITKVRKLISHDKVNLISGVFLATAGYADRSALRRSECSFRHNLGRRR